MSNADLFGGGEPSTPQKRKRDEGARTAARRAADPEGFRSYWLKHMYGITSEQYDEMFRQQGGVCAICGEPETAVRKGTPKRLTVDHCHTTGRVRGLLCHRCNCGLGQFRDNRDALAAAVVYLTFAEVA